MSKTCLQVWLKWVGLMIVMSSVWEFVKSASEVAWRKEAVLVSVPFAACHAYTRTEPKDTTPRLLSLCSAVALGPRTYSSFKKGNLFAPMTRPYPGVVIEVNQEPELERGAAWFQQQSWMELAALVTWVEGRHPQAFVLMEEGEVRRHVWGEVKEMTGAAGEGRGWLVGHLLVGDKAGGHLLVGGEAIVSFATQEPKINVHVPTMVQRNKVVTLKLVTLTNYIVTEYYANYPNTSIVFKFAFHSPGY